MSNIKIKNFGESFYYENKFYDLPKKPIEFYHNDSDMDFLPTGDEDISLEISCKEDWDALCPKDNEVIIIRIFMGNYECSKSIDIERIHRSILKTKDYDVLLNKYECALYEYTIKLKEYNLFAEKANHKEAEVKEQKERELYEKLKEKYENKL